jgi:hypothetical protein
VDWGDENEEYFGPVHLSNLNPIVVSVSHQWDVEGTYLIQAKLIDAYGLESGWGTLEVSMPKSKSNIETLQLFLQNFFQRFPLFEKLLNQIIL